MKNRIIFFIVAAGCCCTSIMLFDWGFLKKKKINNRAGYLNSVEFAQKSVQTGCWYCCIEYFFFHLFLPCLVFITECAIPLLGAISQPGQATYMGTIKYTDTAVLKSRCCTMCGLPGSVVLSLVSTHQPYSGSYWLRLGKARQWKGRSTVQPSVLYCRQESGKQEGKEWPVREWPVGSAMPRCQTLRDGHTSVDIEIRSFCWSVRNNGTARKRMKLSCCSEEKNSRECQTHPFTCA